LDSYEATIEKDHCSPETLHTTIFVISFQGNDFIFSPTVGTEQVLSNIERGVRRLIDDFGAKHLIVVENFDFGKVPFFLSNTTLSQEKTALAQKQHLEYQGLIERLRQDYDGLEEEEDNRPEDCSATTTTTTGRKAKIASFDLFALFDRLHCPKQLDRLGLWDVSHGCVDDRATTQCEAPSGYFFYDSYHPSTKVHREVANGILGLI
jgi:hypothetical protein